MTVNNSVHKTKIPPTKHRQDFYVFFYQSRHIAKLIYFHAISFLLYLLYLIFFIRIFIYVFSQQLVNAPGTSAISNFTHETSCGTIKATTKAMIASDVANANKRQNARRDLHMNFLFEFGKNAAHKSSSKYSADMQSRIRQE